MINGFNCASGAGGAVVGEVIGDIYASQTEYDTQVDKVQAKLNALELDPNNETLQQDYQQLSDQLVDLKQIGVDLSRLGVAIGAMAAGLDINIAADAAANAVENNSLGKEVIKAFVTGGVLLADFIALTELVDEVDTVNAFLAKYNKAPEAQKQQMLQDFAISFSVHMLTTYAEKLGMEKASNVLEPLVAYLEKTGVGQEVVKVFKDTADQIDQGKVTHPKIDGKYPKDNRIILDPNRHFSESGFSEKTLAGNPSLKKSIIPEGVYTKEELQDLHALKSSHTTTRHGHHVTDDHIQHRAKTGEYPDGGKGDVPEISSKFDSKENLIYAKDLTAPSTEAYKNAFSSRDLSKNTFSFSVPAGKSLGYGYRNSTGAAVRKKELKVMTLTETN